VALDTLTTAVRSLPVALILGCVFETSQLMGKLEGQLMINAVTGEVASGRNLMSVHPTERELARANP
jgi:hypothetical protein